MFDSIVFVPGDSTHSGFEYRPGCDIEPRFGYFYADGTVACLNVFAPCGVLLQKSRSPIIRKV